MTVYERLTIVDQFEDRASNRAAVMRACDVMTCYLTQLKRPLPEVAAQAVKVAQAYIAGSTAIGGLHDEVRQISNFLKEARRSDSHLNDALSVIRATEALMRLLEEPRWGGGASEALSNFLELVDGFEQDHRLFEHLLESTFDDSKS
ncbi:hypothetical protein HU230_0006195 [Bradyrhizobium quebecense]|uniref:Uncharacterized protein n=1 Tax=Bradyrhizobium quebecense TaxID=2748629 RepID=A0A973WPZ2_9BRAD|nr:hypothetical protein [Bradyrhizobium quebecense]UGA45628.1 hypothetical protein HU230_0006195 [Bradyrhizobium quebecense]